MTIGIDSQHQKKFQALRTVLSILKNNGNTTARLISHNETMEYLFSHAPIMNEVEEFMQQTERVTRKVSEKRDELIAKGGAQK